MTSSTGTRSDSRRTGGFTLLELILVMVLISTLLAMAAPSLRGFSRGRQTAETAAQMLALTHWARSQAAATGCRFRLNIDPEERTYWLTSQLSGAFERLESDFGRSFDIPAGMTVTVDGPASEDAVPYVQFYPDGRSDVATVELSGSRGERLLVTCTSATERFRILTPQEAGVP